MRRGGLEQPLVVEKAPGSRSASSSSTAVFDRVRTCDNHCPFCFIYQLPHGMRRSLYLQDDDYRLSFLYGNFTTLTRFTEADLERVVTERLGPAVRQHPRHRPDAAGPAAAQPAGRDEPALARRAPRRRRRGPRPGRRLPRRQRRRRARRHAPRRSSTATRGSRPSPPCPSGSAPTPARPSLRAHTRRRGRPRPRPGRARGRPGSSTRSAGGSCYAADEYYLLAGRAFPDADAYDGFAQHENGIGMARTFLAEVAGRARRRRRRRAPGPAPGSSPGSTARPPTATGRPAAPRIESGAGARAAPIGIVTGEYGARVLDAARARARPARRRRRCGSSPSATGSSAATSPSPGCSPAPTSPPRSPREPAGHRYLLPDVVLSRGRFLDGRTVADLPRAGRGRRHRRGVARRRRCR